MYDPVWVCRDGRRMKVGEMEESHVRNCIAKIGRNKRGWRRAWLPRLELELEIRKIMRNP